MNKIIFKALLAIVVLVSLISLGFKADDNNRMSKPTTNDNYNYIAINQILMWIGNNGSGSHDPKTGNGGFYWPGGINANKSAIYQDGFVYASKVGSETRMNGNTHRLGLQAGKVLSNGKADDASLPKYRIYKIRRNWQALPEGPTKEAYKKDWNEWPVDDGAPWIDVNHDGVYDPNVDTPNLIGDEMLWYVANDFDDNKSIGTYGTKGQGLEFQTTVFGFNRTGPLGNMLFKKYTFINKGTNILNDMIIGYWSDPDLGDANDDYAGCDTTLKLGYVWNANNTDAIYGAPAPAVGYVFFQGPKIPYDKVQYPIIGQKSLPDSAKFLGKWIKGATNLPMTAFTFYINPDATYRDPSQGVATGSIEFYNYLSGKVWNGNPFIDPITGKSVVITLAGDPVAKTGWYEGAPAWANAPKPDDRRILMASGPFKMVPGDTQEVVVGIVIAQGTSNLNSITELKNATILAQQAFDVDFNLPPAPPAPKLHALPGNESVTLWWETNAESYAEKNTIISPTAPDKFYRFQGYRVWQFKNLNDDKPTVIGTYDLKDSVTQIDGIVDVNGVKVIAPVIKLNNEGLTRSLNINTNVFTNGKMYNGTPYYFAVTAFAVNKFSLPSSDEFLESTPVPIEVLPTTPKVDLSVPYDVGTNLVAKKISGAGDGFVQFRVVDPTALTGHTYQVILKGSGANLTYSLYNVTKKDTVLKNMKDFGLDSSGKIIVDGFIVIVQNVGQDSLNVLLPAFTNGFKEVIEVANAQGPLAKPKNVLNQFNSTGKWRLFANGQTQTSTTGDQRPNLNWAKACGFNDYELRFTATGSLYHAAFSPINPATANAPKGKGILPFEAWDIGRTASDTAKRLLIKVSDRLVRDSNWTRVDSIEQYEDFSVYQPTGAYPTDAAFPAMSGLSQNSQHRFGFVTIKGQLPEQGTIIRFVTWKPLTQGDVFEVKTEAPNFSDKEAAKDRLSQISVYPNPYFGASALERDKYQRFVRFTNLPTEVNIKIFSLSGVFINELSKSSTTPWLDWNLRTRDGLPVASGVYIAYLDMPGIGKKVMKIAVIMETQYIDRL